MVQFSFFRLKPFLINCQGDGMGKGSPWQKLLCFWLKLNCTRLKLCINKHFLFHFRGPSQMKKAPGNCSKDLYHTDSDMRLIAQFLSIESNP